MAEQDEYGLDYLRKFIDALPHGVGEIGLDGEIILANRSFENLFSLEPGQAQGLNLFELFNDPEERRKFSQSLERARTRPEPPEPCLHSHLRADGTRSLFRIVWDYHRRGDGKVGGILWEVRDITEEEKAQQELKESQQRFMQLTDNVNQVFWLTSTDWKEVFFVSKAYERVWGKNRQSLYDNPLSLAEEIHPEDRGLFFDHLEHNYGRELYPSSFPDFRLLGPGGSVKWIHARYFPVLNSQGQVRSIMGIAEDVTELRLAEQVNQRLEDQLRHAQKMEAIGTLAGGIAHDFNNILGAVVGYTELALDMARSGEEHEKELKQVLSAAGRAKELVRQILAFSRKASADLKPLDLNQVILDSAKILEHTVPKTISIELDLASKLPYLMADANQLGQVLLSLGANAAEAMHGSGRILIKTRHALLDQEFCQSRLNIKPGSYLVMSISDEGEGMDPETLEQIFAPFFTTKEVGGGPGLGLSMVFGIVKGHNGFVECQSDPGQGATFTVYLPAQHPVEKDKKDTQPV